MARSGGMTGRTAKEIQGQDRKKRGVKSVQKIDKEMLGTRRVS